MFGAMEQAVLLIDRIRRLVPRTAPTVDQTTPEACVHRTSFTCNFAAGHAFGGCTDSKATLVGTLNGAPTNASLTQPNGSAPFFEITQGSQKITVTKSFTTGEFLATTASGQPFVTTLLDLVNGF